MLYVTAFAFAAPISTTYTINSVIPGVDSTRRLSAVRWVAGNIVVGWLLTIPAAAACAGLAYVAVRAGLPKTAT